MSWEWTFWTTGTSFTARVACWPIIPGTLTITADDGSISKTVTDDGAGNLVGDAIGTVDYGWGIIECDFTAPLPASGTPVLADYGSTEGGCINDCERCATNKIILDLTPGAISGQGEIAINDAWSRLLDKIRRDVLPIHVELATDEYEEEYIWSVGHRFDVIPADEETVDAAGLRLVFDSTEW